MAVNTQGAAEYVRRNPFVILAVILTCTHTVIVSLYLTGHAISAVPDFRAQTAKAIVTSGWVPVFHAAAAITVLAGILWGHRWREWAKIATFPVWLAYAGILWMSALSRTVPVSWVAASLSLIPLVLSGLLVAGWDDDDQAG